MPAPDTMPILAEEDRLTRILLGLLDEARRALRRRADALDPDSEAVTVITAMLRAVEEAAGRLDSALQAAMAKGRERAADAGEAFALESLPTAEAAVRFGLDPFLLRTIAEYEARYIAGLTAELLQGVSRVVQVGMLSGQSIREMSKDLGLYVREPVGPFRTAQSRCEFIAVHETNRVANVAMFARYQDAATRIDGLEKEWLTAGDGRVRPSHFLLQGVRKPMNEPFDVGGHPGQHPHDDALPMAERARCRCCTVAVVPEED